MVHREPPATASPDLPVVRDWVERNPQAGARLSETVEHGGGEVVLVVSIPDYDEMVRARTEIPSLAQYPDRLRFRRWKPTATETEWTLQWVLGLMRRQRALGLPTHVASVGPHPDSGIVFVQLDKVDREYAAALEVRGDGLLYVEPYRDEGVLLAGPC